MKTSSKKNYLFLFFISMIVHANCQETDSINVYLEKNLNKPMTIDLIFENISSDSVILRSCFRIYDGTMGTASGFMVLVYSGEQLIGLPVGDEPVILRYNNCKTTIPAKSKVAFIMPFNGIYDLSKHETLGVKFRISYIYAYKDRIFSKQITTNYVELYNKEQTISCPHKNNDGYEK